MIISTKKKGVFIMNNNMLIYISKDEKIKVDVNLENESIWMIQDMMAKLYGTTKNNISMH